MKQISPQLHYLICAAVFLLITIPSLYFDGNAFQSVTWLLYLGSAAFVTFVLHFCLKNLRETGSLMGALDGNAAEDSSINPSTKAESVS